MILKSYFMYYKTILPWKAEWLMYWHIMILWHLSWNAITTDCMAVTLDCFCRAWSCRGLRIQACARLHFMILEKYAEKEWREWGSENGLLRWSSY
jgi:hypothetical protein